MAILIAFPFRERLAYEVVGEGKEIIFWCLAVSIYAMAILRLYNLKLPDAAGLYSVFYTVFTDSDVYQKWRILCVLDGTLHITASLYC